MALPVDIYVRVSRVGAREHLTSPEDQEREARAYAKSRGLTVAEVLPDIDESGGTLDRPALQQAISRVRAGETAGIVIAYLDRASRETVQGLTLLDEITAAGGAVYAPNLPDYETADGRMLTTIQLAIATGFRQRKTEEFERAKRAAIERGIPVHTRPPVGYRARADRRLESDPETAPHVRQVFERRAQGVGPTALADYLEGNGVTTSQGSTHWSKQAIYGLIKNRVYLGELSYGRDRRYVNPNAHEPIVDLATWTAAQHPNGSVSHVREGSYLLAGILRCAGCRYAMQGTKSGRGVRVYRCTKRHAAGICHETAYVKADEVEQAVIEAFWRITADLEAQGSDEDTGLDGLEEALASADRALAGWMSPEVQAAIGDTTEYATGLRERIETRDTAAAALGVARARQPRGVVSVKSLCESWERMTLGERREFLALRFDAIAIRKDRSLVVYPTGSLSIDLPRRGFKQAPALVGFPEPPREAWVFSP